MLPVVDCFLTTRLKSTRVESTWEGVKGIYTPYSRSLSLFFNPILIHFTSLYFTFLHSTLLISSLSITRPLHSTLLYIVTTILRHCKRSLEDNIPKRSRRAPCLWQISRHTHWAYSLFYTIPRGQHTQKEAIELTVYDRYNATQKEKRQVQWYVQKTNK